MDHKETKTIDYRVSQLEGRLKNIEAKLQSHAQELRVIKLIMAVPSADTKLEQVSRIICRHVRTVIFGSDWTTAELEEVVNN